MNVWATPLICLLLRARRLASVSPGRISRRTSPSELADNISQFAWTSSKKETVAERLPALHIRNMSEHKVTLKWERGGTEFSYQRYPRDHTWSFDGGHTMTATAAPAYLGNPANVDPEEAFVASLASCHMLTFLSIACKQKFVLDSYEDEAVGHMEKNADGKLAITRVELRPKITWSGNRRPSVEELDKMHHAAHENCFIANSVKTNVTVAER
jgi:organic hydroperoxide reductase OsmC/OhrA